VCVIEKGAHFVTASSLSDWVFRQALW